MKILRITPFPPEFLGGIQIYCKNLSVNLAKIKNVESIILAPNILKKKITSKEIHQKVNLVYTTCYTYLWNKNPLTFVLSYLKKNYQNFDLIHAHGYYYFSTIQCALLKRIKNFPLLLHIHGGIQTPQFSNSSLIEKFQLAFKEKIFDRSLGMIPFRYSDRIISASQNDLKIIQKKFKVNENKVLHIPNAVDLIKFKRDVSLERKYITLLATRLTYVKGIDIYLKIIKELFKKNKNLEFLIIGDGPLKHLVFDAMKTLPIKYIPQYSYDKMQDVYNMSKIIIITSRTEGVPNIIYESLACETPIVSSNVGGISNVIKDGENGYLFNISNINRAVDIILNIINDDQELKRLGCNGRDLMKKEYTWEIVTDKIYSIYKSGVLKKEF